MFWKAFKEQIIWPITDFLWIPHEVMKPLCCGCSHQSTGRICYAGKPDKIVDNPFCADCYPEIYKQTVKLLRRLYKDEVEGKYILIEKWYYYEAPASLPANFGQIMTRGKRITTDLDG